VSGEAMKYSLDFANPSASSLVKWQQHFRLDDRTISHGLGTDLDAVGADLLDLAVAVYVADRLCPRRPPRVRSDGSWWRREIRLRTAVRCPEAWGGGVLDRFIELLEWLTDDAWKFELVPGLPQRRGDGQGSLFPETLAEPVDVSLFSGGLDSLLGAVSDLDGEGELILVAAGTGSRLIGKQRELAAALKGLGRRRVRLLSIPVGLTEDGKGLIDDRDESSQRSRGLVFAALGAVVARAADVSQLRLHENGPGAMNLPLTAGQAGSMNTRAARPETLRKMSLLFSELFEHDFEIVNPAFWKTKAEMCAAAPADAHGLMKASVTCDSGLTRRVKKGQLCGQCTSCLLRRQALLAAGLTEVDRSDLDHMVGDALATQRTHADVMVLAMLGQAADISLALKNEDPWSELVDRFPELPSIRRALNVRPERLVDLLARYVRDWQRVRRPLVDELVAAGAPA
jgi:7-cyano-7-deazaguanine synthase in queuosine biosynthesis